MHAERQLKCFIGILFFLVTLGTLFQRQSVTNTSEVSAFMVTENQEVFNTNNVVCADAYEPSFKDDAAQQKSRCAWRGLYGQYGPYPCGPQVMTAERTAERQLAAVINRDHERNKERLEVNTEYEVPALGAIATNLVKEVTSECLQEYVRDLQAREEAHQMTHGVMQQLRRVNQTTCAIRALRARLANKGCNASAGCEQCDHYTIGSYEDLTGAEAVASAAAHAPGARHAEVVVRARSRTVEAYIIFPRRPVAPQRHFKYSAHTSSAERPAGTAAGDEERLEGGRAGSPHEFSEKRGRRDRGVNSGPHWKRIRLFIRWCGYDAYAAARRSVAPKVFAANPRRSDFVTCLQHGMRSVVPRRFRRKFRPFPEINPMQLPTTSGCMVDAERDLEMIAVAEAVEGRFTNVSINVESTEISFPFADTDGDGVCEAACPRYILASPLPNLLQEAVPCVSCGRLRGTAWLQLFKSKQVHVADVARRRASARTCDAAARGAVPVGGNAAVRRGVDAAPLDLRTKDPEYLYMESWYAFSKAVNFWGLPDGERDAG